jgi:hypothetical protein
MTIEGGCEAVSRSRLIQRRIVDHKRRDIIRRERVCVLGGGGIKQHEEEKKNSVESRIEHLIPICACM